MMRQIGDGRTIFLNRKRDGTQVHKNESNQSAGPVYQLALCLTANVSECLFQSVCQAARHAVWKHTQP